MLSVDIQYLNLLPINEIKQISSTKWNFRCPVCGDSKKNENLKRGNAQIWNGELFIKCFNCAYSKPFSFFIKTEFPEYYKNYRLDKMNWRNCITKTVNICKNKIIKREYTKIELLNLNKLDELHIASKFVRQRKIPNKFYDKLYYTDNFMDWVNTIKDDACYSVKKYDKRLVIPIYDKFKRLIGVQGRTLEMHGFPKYQTIKLDETYDILYGIDRIDSNKTIYVTEGPIDSMFLNNSIATCTSISKFKLLQQIAPVEQFVLVYDNEKRNSDTVRYMKNALTLGFTVVIWDKDIVEKDINDMVIKNNLTIKELHDIIHLNSYSANHGLIKLNFWKK